MSEIGWLPLSDRRQFQKLVSMYKIVNGTAPDYLCNLLPLLVTERTIYNLRNAENISIMNRRTEIFAKSFIPSGSLLRNNLPLSIRSETSVNSFKLKLKQHEPGRVAQSVGHLTRKSGVLGSIPGLATYFRFSFCFFKKGSCQLLAKVCARSTG